MANAFQHNAFQQTIGFVAFQEFTEVTVVSSGRYITEAEVQESIKKKIYQEGTEAIYRRIAATELGRKGGLSYASKFKR